MTGDQEFAMQGKFDKYSRRMTLVFSALVGAVVMLAANGGCMNTLEGVGRDFMGAWDGMAAVHESNGENVRSRR